MRVNTQLYDFAPDKEESSSIDRKKAINAFAYINISTYPQIKILK